MFSSLSLQCCIFMKHSPTRSGKRTKHLTNTFRILRFKEDRNCSHNSWSSLYFLNMFLVEIELHHFPFPFPPFNPSNAPTNSQVDRLFFFYYYCYTNTIHMCMYVHMWVCICECMYMCICMCICTYEYMCMHMYMCVCTYVYTQIYEYNHYEFNFYYLHVYGFRVDKSLLDNE